jgi:hypothetical protein
LDKFAGKSGCRSARRKLALPLTRILALFLFSFQNSNAQTTNSGGLTGVVSDASQAVVPAAIVKLCNDTKGTLQTTKTDREGVYRFFFLAPGRYTLSVSHDGFRLESQDVDVLLGPPGTRNITLGIATEGVTVNVTAERPLL